MNKMILSFFICFLLILSVLCGCTEQSDEKDEKNDDNNGEIISYDSNTINSRFGFMHPDDFADMTDLGIFWQRPHPGPFVWGRIETSSGVFNWDECDKEVERSQKYGVNVLATVWPFADWDQSSCHTKLSNAGALIFGELGDYRQKPCDMSAYQNFITKLVERYDGDGVDDMPGLVVPIKYWEVSNEPSMQNEWLTFFIGPAENYYDILKATYQSVKSADDSAVVVQGGMAGVFVDHTEFWDYVIDLGGSDYFDIANIHSINSDSEAINSPEFKQYLDQHGIDKSFWVTEVEIGSMDEEKNGESQDDNSDLLITNVIQAFEGGADKIFLPGIMNPSTFKDEKPGLVNSYYATQVLAGKLNYFNSI